MRRASIVVLGLVLLASSSGCCCIDRLFCCGLGGCGGYGHEGPCCDGYGGCGGGGCGGGGCGGGGCSDCGGYAGQMGGQVPGPEDGMYSEGANGGGGGGGNPAMARRAPKYRPAQGHPHAYQRRNSGGEYEFAAGPPTGGVTYPYYTNRGPRDFLARNPRGIGP